MAEAALIVPSALSWDPESPHYNAVLVRLGGLFEVLLDGQEVRDCVSYNCDEGWVVIHPRSTGGNKQLDPAAPPDLPRVLSQTLRGHVTLRLNEPVAGQPPVRLYDKDIAQAA
jgi:hypothetical protein